MPHLHSINTKDYWKMLNATSRDRECAVNSDDMYNYLIDANEDTPVMYM